MKIKFHFVNQNQKSKSKMKIKIENENGFSKSDFTFFFKKNCKKSREVERVKQARNRGSKEPESFRSKPFRERSSRVGKGCSEPIPRPGFRAIRSEPYQLPFPAVLSTILPANAY
jgi:hypothetical protein